MNPGIPIKDTTRTYYLSIVHSELTSRGCPTLTCWALNMMTSSNCTLQACLPKTMVVGNTTFGDSYFLTLQGGLSLAVSWCHRELQSGTRFATNMLQKVSIRPVFLTDQRLSGGGGAASNPLL